MADSACMAWARHAFGRIRGLAQGFGVMPTVPVRNWRRVTGSGAWQLPMMPLLRAPF